MSKPSIQLGIRSRIASICLAPLILSGNALGFQLTFGVGQLNIPDHFQSDGSTPIPKFAGYRFELGTFLDKPDGTPFVPTDTNTDDWLEFWRPIEDSSGDANPLGNAEYGEFPTLFGDATGFNVSFQFDHANAPFTPGTQMYLWGYDQRDIPGAAQWVLFTNPVEWTLNDGTDEVAFAQEFYSGGATVDEVGTVVDGLVTLGAVVVPSSTPPAISIADAERSETGGTVSVMLTLSELSSSDVTVECSTVGGSAVSGQDYSVIDGTITVPSGQLSVAIDVTILNDVDNETDETFQVLLDSPVGATLADPSATVTIRDDDALAALAEGGGIERDGGSGDLSVTWPAVVGREYSVLFSHDLENWQPVAGGDSIIADAAAERFVLPDDAARCFYMVVDLAPPAP